MPDDDAGLEDLEDALHHVAFTKGGTEAMAAFCRKWAPWLSENDARALCARIAADPKRFEADELGERMRLDMLDRERLGIKTFSAFNMPKHVTLIDGTRFALRADFQRRMKNAKRKAERKRSTKQTITAAKPWKAEGVSRATWYRRKAEANAVL